MSLDKSQMEIEINYLSVSVYVVYLRIVFTETLRYKPAFFSLRQYEVQPQ
jgi:hypothetical protein